MRLISITLSCLAVLIMSLPLSAGDTVRYSLHVRDTLVAYNGQSRHAIAVNGQIPMPTLTFYEGDVAVITVYNHLQTPTSLHWHGVFLPNNEDGVPFVTQNPIAPGEVYTYSFPVIQNGTHWYHSHSGLQEQIGMYGSLIFKKRTTDPAFRIGIDDVPEQTLLVSDWTDMDPDYVHHLLMTGSDWFAIKKGATQNYGEATVQGHLQDKFINEWKRMTAMDVSDIYYDRILLNGKQSESLSLSDSIIKLRVINGSASSYFWLSYAGGKVKVVSNDGNDVVPVSVDRLLIATSETYDLLVSVPKGKTYEFLITSEDRTQSARLWLGSGDTVFAYQWPRLSYFDGMQMMNQMMHIDGSMDDMGMQMSMQVMDMNAAMYPERDKEIRLAQQDSTRQTQNTLTKGFPVTLNYTMLRAPEKTSIQEFTEIKELHFTLEGNMQRYLWSMNGKVLSEADVIEIPQNALVRIILTNNSMMRHPMHLHGHDFRIVNGQGEYAPLKNVLDIMPMESDTIEFLANAPGDWFFHCHILYHMMGGMGRIINIQNTAASEPGNPYFDKRNLYRDDRKLHFMVENNFSTNGNDGMLELRDTRWSFSGDWRLGYTAHHGYEADVRFGRYLGTMQWFIPYIGFDCRYREMAEQTNSVFGQESNPDDRTMFFVGFQYTLPLLWQLQANWYQNGLVRLQLMRDDIPLTSRLRMQLMVNSDKEYMVGFNYILKPYLAVSTHYDSDMGLGVGLLIKY